MARVAKALAKAACRVAKLESSTVLLTCENKLEEAAVTI